jgi:hypothetical protein
MNGYVISKRSDDFALYVGESFPDVSCQRIPNNTHMGIIVSFGANGHVQTYHLQRLVISPSSQGRRYIWCDGLPRQNICGMKDALPELVGFHQ